MTEDNAATKGGGGATVGAGVNDSQTPHLTRSIDWKQGVIIAMGVPILILPSIYDLSINIWGLSVLVWTLSVVQGFLQNFAIGEMAATFGVAGIGGCVQYVFRNDEYYKVKPVNWGKFIGAFSAWSYWFTWTPVIPIFTLMTGDYLRSYFSSAFEGVDNFMPFVFLNNPTSLGIILFNLMLGIIIFSTIIYIGSKGLSGGAKAQLLLAAITIVPLVIVVLIPFFNGNFSLSRFGENWLPADWNWEFSTIALVIGCSAVAQWSACAWESAATYGAEYKNPGKDLPKALISCGLICLFMYFLVSFSTFGTLTVNQINNVWGYATLIPLCKGDFGEIGGAIAMILLISGMVMLIQTAFLGSSRTLFVMSQQGNMPRLLSHTTKTGAPIYAMAFQFMMGIIMIPLGTPGMILAASSFGFCFALGMAMVSFIRARKNPRFKDVPRPWRAPRGWLYVAYVLAFYQFFVLIPCLAYESSQAYGIMSVVIGAIILLIYIPLWFMLQAYNKKHYGSASPDVHEGERSEFEKEV